MNELTDERRYQLKIAVVLIAIFFLIIYGTVMVLKYTNQSQQEKQTNNKPQVVFQQPTLTFFEYKKQLNLYPDRIMIHYPYLIVVKPDEFRSEIYNMATKRREKGLNEIVLDYLKSDVVYNKQAYTTLFNKKDLGLLCDRAFIQSTTKILCITRPDQNKQENKLIEINPETLKQKDIYTSQNVLTAIYSDKNTIYIGEYDFAKNKAHITVNGKTALIDDLVNVIYPMGDNMYAASFKSLRNNQTEKYYKINLSKNKILSELIDKKKIIFH